MKGMTKIRTVSLLLSSLLLFSSCSAASKELEAYSSDMLHSQTEISSQSEETNSSPESAGENTIQKQPGISSEGSSSANSEVSAGREPSPVSSGPESQAGLEMQPPEISASYPYYIRVNKRENCVTVYKKGSDGRFTVPVKAMVCSTGPDTPLGTFRTSDQYIWRALVHNVYGQYATRITGSILFHSVPYEKMNKATLQADEYNKLGSSASAGCVRLTAEDAKWILDNCPKGTTVTIYEDPDPGPLGKPTAQKIPSDSKWDPTDPDRSNPWRLQAKDARITGVKNQVIELGGWFQPFLGISGCGWQRS